MQSDLLKQLMWLATANKSALFLSSEKTNNSTYCEICLRHHFGILPRVVTFTACLNGLDRFRKWLWNIYEAKSHLTFPLYLPQMSQLSPKLELTFRKLELFLGPVSNFAYNWEFVTYICNTVTKACKSVTYICKIDLNL